jgi:hypothetical protein
VFGVLERFYVCIELNWGFFGADCLFLAAVGRQADSEASERLGFGMLCFEPLVMSFIERNRFPRLSRAS